MTVNSLPGIGFTDRAVVLRNATATTDVMGQPGAPSYQAHATLPCRFWNKASRRIVDEKKTATMESLRCAFAVDADVAADDLISSIQDRQGNTLLAGPVRLRAPEFHRAHVAYELEKIASP